MKKVFVFIVMSIVLIGSCAAQSTNSEIQWIIGTWSNYDNYSLGYDAGDLGVGIWGFNADGTVTIGGNSHLFGISADGDIFITGVGIGTLYMSPDGKRMIITLGRYTHILKKE